MVGLGRKAHLTIERTEGGQQDPESGVYEPADSITVYDSTVTWQEGIAARSVERVESQLGVAVEEVEFTLFLTLESKISDIRLQDRGTLRLPDGDEVRVSVVGIRKMDSSVFVDKNG